MRKLFREYYEKRSQSELKKLWSEAYFVFDTNVLLSFYEWTKETREDWLSVLNKVGRDRLWMPYQIAREYHEHLDGTIREHIANRNKLVTATLDAVKGPSFRQFNDKKFFFSHLAENFFESHSQTWTKADNEWKGNVRAAVKAAAEQYQSDCRVLSDILSKVFDGRVGVQYTNAKLIEMSGIADVRRTNRVPPGFEDTEKKTNQNGDVFVWLELLEETKRINKPVVFVTLDTKLDWFIRRYSDNSYCPRPELIEEMRGFANQDCLIYAADEFLKLSTEFLKVITKEESLLEVKDTVSEKYAVPTEDYRSLMQSLHVRIAMLSQSILDKDEFLSQFDLKKRHSDLLLIEINAAIRERRRLVADRERARARLQELRMLMMSRENSADLQIVQSEGGDDTMS